VSLSGLAASGHGAPSEVTSTKREQGKPKPESQTQHASKTPNSYQTTQHQQPPRHTHAVSYSLLPPIPATASINTHTAASATRDAPWSEARNAHAKITHTNIKFFFHQALHAYPSPLDIQPNRQHPHSEPIAHPEHGQHRDQRCHSAWAVAGARLVARARCIASAELAGAFPLSELASSLPRGRVGRHPTQSAHHFGQAQQRATTGGWVRGGAGGRTSVTTDTIACEVGDELGDEVGASQSRGLFG